jgi:hypothetical protein
MIWPDLEVPIPNPKIDPKIAHYSHHPQRDGLPCADQSAAANSSAETVPSHNPRAHAVGVDAVLLQTTTVIWANTIAKIARETVSIRTPPSIVKIETVRRFAESPAIPG